MDTVTILTTKGGLYATKRLRYTGSAWLTTGNSKAKHFSVEVREVHDIFGLSALLDELAGCPHSLIVRGEPIESIDRTCTRRLSNTKKEHDGSVSHATLLPRARYWIPLDLDGLPMPPGGIDPLTDPKAAVKHVVSMLPSEFEGVTVRWNFTSSMTFKQGLRMRLYFWSSCLLDDWQLRQWLGECVAIEGQPKKEWQRVWPVDASVFGCAQEIYTARPIISGSPDPVPTRSGLLIGDRHVVTPPTIEMPEPPPRGDKGGRRKVSAGGERRTAKVASGSSAYKPGGIGYEYHRSMIGDHVGSGGYHGPINLNPAVGGIGSANISAFFNRR